MENELSELLKCLDQDDKKKLLDQIITHCDLKISEQDLKSFVCHPHSAA
jgi:hypothetical protein